MVYWLIQCQRSNGHQGIGSSWALAFLFLHSFLLACLKSWQKWGKNSVGPKLALTGICLAQEGDPAGREGAPRERGKKPAQQGLYNWPQGIEQEQGRNG